MDAGRMRMKSRQRRWVFGLAVALVLGLSLVPAACDGGVRETDEGPEATSGGGTPAPGELSASLNGAGATFPEPLYLEWIGEFMTSVEPDVSINYQGIGSGGGIQQFTQMTVDFGASDAPMTDEEVSAAEEASGARVLHIPTAFGAVALAYNLEGVNGLKLDAETVAGIFLGEITNWSDPAIAALNEGVGLPDQEIQSVHRSDSSGTTSIFTDYLDTVSPAWQERVGKGKEVDWPGGVGGQGNDGVAAVVQQQAGSLGYVELSYAIESQLPVVTLKNKAGNFVEPSLDATKAAAEGVDFPEDLRFSLTNSEGEGAYPIVGSTWILAYDKMEDVAKAEALKAYLTWALEEGDAIATDLLYAPLPDDLQILALDKVNSIGGN
jgi:phosphate transport system substrate-binding protein